MQMFLISQYFYWITQGCYIIGCSYFARKDNSVKVRFSKGKIFLALICSIVWIWIILWNRWIVQAMKHELKIRAGDMPPQDIYQMSPSDVKQLLLDVLQPQQTGRYLNLIPTSCCVIIPQNCHGFILILAYFFLQILFRILSTCMCSYILLELTILAWFSHNNPFYIFFPNRNLSLLSVF